MVSLLCAGFAGAPSAAAERATRDTANHVVAVATRSDGSVVVTLPDGLTVEPGFVAPAAAARTAPAPVSTLDADAPATIIHVPGDQPTIQAGIAAAATGDTVLVAPGVYGENINFLGKAIAVVSSGGPDVTVIDGGQVNSVVRFVSGEGPLSVLRGFTLQNGRASQLEGGGIFINSASPTVVRNVVQFNGGCNGGGGIGIASGSPQVRGNVVRGNFQAGCSGGIGGGGIAIRGAGFAQLVGNIVENNTWGLHGGGISLFAAGNMPRLANNVVRNNSAGNGEGGGVWIVNETDVLMIQNLFYGNQSASGSAVWLLVPNAPLAPLMVNNTFVSAVLGSTVYVAGFDNLVRFYNNVALGFVGQTAVFCDPFYGPQSPTFTANDAYSPGGQGLAGTCAGQGSQNGNLSVDPAFVDPAAGNFRLGAGSPAIDAGTNTAPNLPATDLAGRPRIVDGDGDGTATIDMGPYEIPLGGYEPLEPR